MLDPTHVAEIVGAIFLALIGGLALVGALLWLGILFLAVTRTDNSTPRRNRSVNGAQH